MSSTNQRLIEKAKDDHLTDYQPHYRQDIFGEVYKARPAYERRMARAKDQFERIWLTEQRTLDGAMDRFNEQFDKTLKSSEERNEAIKKVFDSLSTV